MISTPPNMVLVSIDSLRGDHCGHLGDDRGLTPTMDSLAEEGVVFENAIAPGPQTFSSMPTVFTGYHRPPDTLEGYPQNSYLERRLAAIDNHLYRLSTITERLQDLGYATAAVSPNPWTSPMTGFDRGFDHFEDFSDHESSGWPRALAERIPGVDLDRRLELLLNMVGGRSFFAQWESFYDEIQRIREQLPEPYFLWIFLLDTHFPFLPSGTHREEQTLLGTYYSMYRSADPMRGKSGEMPARVREGVQRSYRDTVRASDAFLERLRTDFATDDPVLIVHSDHGESFGEHGLYGHHHRRVYEENVHVPYIVHNAGIEENISVPTSLATIHETALTIAREGTFDPTTATETYVVASSECGTFRTVRGHRFKYIEQDGDEFLFDLHSDPDERTDISGQRPDVCQRLRGRLDEHTEEASSSEQVQYAHQ